MSITKLYKGRASRTDFFFWMILFIGLYYLSNLPLFLLSFTESSRNHSFLIDLLQLIFVAVSTYFFFAIIVKRLHDLGYSGWFSLIMILPVANVLVALLLLILPGEKKKNTYGGVPGK